MFEPDAEEVHRALAEDIGADGDVTTRALADAAERRVTGRVIAKSDVVVAGLAEAALAFEARGATLTERVADGARAKRGDVVATVTGTAAAVLSGERVALNYLMRMSGIATATAALADAARVANPRCRVAATRKTTPLFRRAEKRAVVLGGGDPHRWGLSDAFLAKDNHRALLPDVAEFVRRARALHADKFLQVEVESLEDAFAAADAGADALLLDNLTPDAFAEWAARLREKHPRVMLEASGGITPATLPAYAKHADRVSVGWITHSAPAADYSLEVDVE